jgi:hypothetical protein
VLVHPQDFRVVREIGHHIQIGVLVTLAPHPADMRLEQPVLARRYRIVRPFDVLVVAAVHRRPPQRTMLTALRRDDGKHELHAARALEGAMRKIAVVDRLDAEHAHRVAGGRQQHQRPGRRIQEGRHQRGTEQDDVTHTGLVDRFCDLPAVSGARRNSCTHAKSSRGKRT